MKLKVSFQNQGGELDSRVVESADRDRAGALARATAINLLEFTPHLCAGDKIVVEEVEE